MARKVNARCQEMSSSEIFDDSLPNDCSFQALENHTGVDSDLIFCGLEDFDDVLLEESDESLVFTNLRTTGFAMDATASAELPLTSGESQTDLPNKQTNLQTADTTSNKCFSKEFIGNDQNQGSSSDNYSDHTDTVTSKNLVSERKRRRKLNEKLFSLRALVPMISKMDKASIVADAIAYVQNLHKQIQELEADISGLRCHKPGQNSPKRPIPGNGASMDMDAELQCSYGKRQRIQLSESEKNGGDIEGFNILELEVSKVEAKTFFLQISCKRRAGVITQLARALEHVNMVIINANITTFHACILNTVLVEVNKWEALQADQIRQVILAAASMYGFRKI